jgi:hypothetical protein
MELLFLSCPPIKWSNVEGEAPQKQLLPEKEAGKVYLKTLCHLQVEKPFTTRVPLL